MLDVLGLHGWVDEGCYDTEYGNRRLWKGQRSLAFKDAMRFCGHILRAFGFDDRDNLRVKLWIGDDYDHELAVLACAEVEAYIPIAREHERMRPVHAERELRDLVLNRPWLLQGVELADAQALVANDRFRYTARVEHLLKLAARTERRTAERMSAPIEPVAGDRVEAIHDALRLVSSCDADGARYINGHGWGKATSTAGHWLSRRSRLTPEEAAHGLKLLKVHRGQLPRDVRQAVGL